MVFNAPVSPGRGYLDSVQLVSAQRGAGRPAHWAWTCRCPLGHGGDLCDRCSAGFKRTRPAEGAFSPCEPCDPHTGDCYSADETPGERSCPTGFYQDRRNPGTCLKCPCPDGASCTLEGGSQQPRCDRCPRGSTGNAPRVCSSRTVTHRLLPGSGPHCEVCGEGFYGDPAGVGGVQRPCRPCQCNGHISASTPGSCDGSTGECLKCVNHTRGRSCQSCRPGFYHRRPWEACTRNVPFCSSTWVRVPNSRS